MGRARDLRLLEDQRKIEELAEKMDYFNIRDKRGLPPTEYLFDFCLQGYTNKEGEIASDHIVRLSLPERYPFSAPPKFSILKGLYHPNVYKNGDVCHGWFLNNWHPAIRIDDLILDVAKMIAFKADSYNLKSPANYDCDREWIDAHQIPLDETVLNPQEVLQNEAKSNFSFEKAPNKQRRVQKKIRVKVKSDTPEKSNFLTSFGSKIESIRPEPKTVPAPIRVRFKR